MALPIITLAARIVHTGRGGPIDYGAVTIVGERVTWVGSAANAADNVTHDLGAVAIVAGLVNAHAHLEFSALSRPLGRPGMAFPDWIQAVVEWRRSADAQLPKHSAAAATVAGINACSQYGVTGLGEIVRSGWPQGAFAIAPLETVAFWESLGPTAERALGQPAAAAMHLDGEQISERVVRGLSPHAPYTVRLDLLDQLVELAAVRRAPLAMHLAESPEEIELLRTGGGPFVELLRGFNAWDGELVARDVRSLAYLERLARAARSLVVHGNYLADDELRFLAENSDRMSLAYCPRTHAYFRHPRHPLPRLLALGGNATIGTDSLASNPDLNLWEELKFVSRNFAEISPRTVLEMGTWRGARAIGLGDRMGVIEPGMLANLAVVGTPGGMVGSPAHSTEHLFDDATRIVAAMHRGVWVNVDPNESGGFTE